MDNIWRLTGEEKAGMDTIAFQICENCCQAAASPTRKGTGNIEVGP